MTIFEEICTKKKWKNK